jgi:hypothetical protein
LRADSLDNDYHVAAGLAMICSNVLEGYMTFNSFDNRMAATARS